MGIPLAARFAARDNRVGVAIKRIFYTLDKHNACKIMSKLINIFSAGKTLCDVGWDLCFRDNVRKC